MTHEPDPLENRADYLVPLNKLSPERRQRLLAQAQVIDLRRKQQLFAQGDRDDYTFYLLEGTLELYADGSLIKRVTGGEGPAYQPLAQLQPRQMSAMATTAAQVLRLRRSLLEQLLSAAAPPPTTASPAAAIEVIEAASGDDWLVALLQSDLFTHVPPANVQALLDILEPFDVAPGTAVIRQGDPGDYYYVIQAGRCEVVRAGARGRSIRLAELGPGDTFGEEALVSGATRNATVRMLDAGRLARLTKDDFARLIKAPLLDAVDRAEAERRVAAGARWLDVRFEDEHAHNGLPGSLNIPLGMLRMRMQELDPAVPWVAYCDTGGRSSSAAFLLSGHGFEACYVIDGAVAEHATTTAVVTPPVAGGARPGPQPAGSVPPAVAPAAVGDAADTALADERERLTAEAARLHEELAKTARLREALAAERAAVEAEREAASADAARLEARAAERLREAERRARAELEAERQRLAALYAKQAEQLEATQADREATLRAELA
ncbi:MAG: cyclic nucleotide-binding domain-containing protein, partial [Gammaproteobacteria bacterium]